MTSKFKDLLKNKPVSSKKFPGLFFNLISIVQAQELSQLNDDSTSSMEYDVPIINWFFENVFCDKDGNKFDESQDKIALYQLSAKDIFKAIEEFKEKTSIYF